MTLTRVPSVKQICSDFTGLTNFLQLEMTFFCKMLKTKHLLLLLITDTVYSIYTIYIYVQLCAYVNILNLTKTKLDN